jgi:hypothetical protein
VGKYLVVQCTFVEPLTQLLFVLQQRRGRQKLLNGITVVLTIPLHARSNLAGIRKAACEMAMNGENDREDLYLMTTLLEVW